MLLGGCRWEDRRSSGWSSLPAATGGGGGRRGIRRAGPAAAAEWANLSEVLEKLLLGPAQGDGRWEDAHVHIVHAQHRPETRSGGHHDYARSMSQSARHHAKSC